MAPFVTTLSNLHPYMTSSVVKVRCVRCYPLRRSGKADIISLECVFHDNEGTKIHCTIPKCLVKKFHDKIKEFGVYLIRHFFLRPNSMRFKTTNHAHRMLFFQKSEVCEVFEVDFPKHIFNFKSFEEIAAIENANDENLFDVIGVIVGKGYIKDQNNAKLIELVLEDKFHNKLYCTLWEDYVDVFVKQVDHKLKKIPIVIVQFCRPSNFRGDIRVSTTYNASKVLLNQDIKDIHDLRLQIAGDESFLRCDSLILEAITKEDEELAAGTLSLKTLEDLFCLEDGSYWICAKVESVYCQHEWYYMACNKCSKKVSKMRTRFFCDRCNRYDGTATKRFMLNVTVVDGTGNAGLQLWDKECVMLVGKNAAEFCVGDDESGESYIIPKEIEDALIGQIVLFKIQLRSEAEFQVDHPYSVVKICYTPEIVKMYASKCVGLQTKLSIDEISEQAFIDECKSLSHITYLPSLSEVEKSYEWELVTPRVGACGEDDVVWLEDGSEKLSAQEFCLDPKADMRGKGKGKLAEAVGWHDESVKRCLEDEFEEGVAEKKARVEVKQEKD